MSRLKLAIRPFLRFLCKGYLVNYVVRGKLKQFALCGYSFWISQFVQPNKGEVQPILLELQIPVGSSKSWLEISETGKLTLLCKLIMNITDTLLHTPS